jgi:dihydromethanopterin reductase (acceptor)
MKRIGWCITGAGHFLTESVELATGLPNMDIFLSRAAEEVTRMYNLEKKIYESDARLYDAHHSLASAPLVGRLARGTYSVLVVAPASGNSIAKFAYGISDTLITNMFAQAGKSRVPIIVLPTDVAEEVDSPDPKGQLVKVYPRPVDLENVAKLKGFPGVTVVTSPEELSANLDQYL